MHRLPRLSLAAALVASVGVVGIGSPVARADGSPDVQLSKFSPEEVLYGDPIPVELTASTAAGQPDGFNLGFNDVLPAGAIFLDSTPSPTSILEQPDGSTVLVWENVADLLAGATVQLDYSFTIDPAVFDIGDTVTNTAGAYASTDPRALPDFDPATGAATGDFDGSATTTADTDLIPFEITKDEPNAEAELLRGVHDNKTVYTLTVDNNPLIASNDFSLVDYLPAGLEFLGCTAVDNSTAGDVEYSGSVVGADRRIDDTGHPAFSNPCAIPSDVTTVLIDPDGVGPLTEDVYTQVTWDSASLATALGSNALGAGGTLSIDYAAAIALQENEVAGLTDPTSNLDNNTGALTTDEQTLENFAIVTGTTDGTTYTDDDIHLVSAEDVSIHKTVDTQDFLQGSSSTWTLFIESSEYAQDTATIVVTDLIPDGVEYTSATPAADSVTNNADGTQTVVWNIPAFTAPNSDFTISLNTTSLQDYRATGGPVSSNDTWTNTVDLATTATIVTDNDGSTTPDVPLPDSSFARQSARSVTILKEVSAPSAGTLDCGDGSGITFDAELGADYRAGDRVCWRLSVDFPGQLDTISPQIKDFLPAGYAYESWTFGAGHNYGTTGVDFVSDAADQAAGNLVWDLDDADATGLTVEFVVSTIIDPTAPLDNADITTNLMKFSYVNTNGSVFQLRDEADARYIEPVLTAGKSPSAGPFQGGDTATYTVTFTNEGFLQADNATIVDTLPAGITCADVTSLGGSTCADGTGTTTLTWTGIDVPAASDTDPVVAGTVDLVYGITLPSTFDPGAELDNSVTMTSYETPDNVDGTPNTFSDGPTATASIDIIDATLSKTRATAITEDGNTAAQATIGETVTYVVTATIPAETTINGAVVRDVMPAGIRLDSASVVFENATGNVPFPGTFVSDASGFTATFDDPYTTGSADNTLTVTVVSTVTDEAGTTAGDNLRNRATFVWDEGSITRRRDTTIVEPDIGNTKDENDADDIVDPGQEVEYTVSVTNGGSVAHDVVVTDVLPADLTPLTGPGGTDVAAGGTVASGGVWDGADTITWTIPSIDSAGIDLTYQVRVANPLTGSAELTNTVDTTASSIAGPDTDERTTYSASASDSVAAPVINVSDKVSDVSELTVGELAAYTVGIEIPAGVVAFDLTVLDTLPAGLEFESFVSSTCSEPGAAACTPARPVTSLNATGDTGTLGFFIGDLAPGSAEAQSISFTYRARVLDVAAATDGADLDNSAAASFNRTDKIAGTPATPPPVGDFDATTEPQVAEVDVVEPELTIDKNVAGQTADTDTRRAKPGDTLTFTVAVTNSGSSDAYDVVVSDTPDPRLTGYSFTPVAGVVNSDSVLTDGSLEWTVAGPIAPGSTVTIVYTLTIPNTLDEAAEVAGFEVTNTADIPTYAAVPVATRNANPTTSYRDYTDTAADTVNIELDLASIGDRVWYDIDGDGVQDAGEPGLEGVDVTVTFLNGPGAADDEIVTVTTGTDGAWLVDELPGGNYTVTVDAGDIPAGLSPSFDLDGTPDNTWSGMLGGDEAKRDVDFGYDGTGSIGDTIWLDRNGDGIQTADEPGIGGVDVTITWAGPDGDLSTTDDNVVYTDTTDVDGEYTVTDLPAGSFDVTVGEGTLPAGTTQTFDLIGGTATPSATAVVTLAAGEDRDDVDFGYRGDSSIGDTVYLDRDNDGAQDLVGDDSDEPGLAGVDVDVVWAGPDGDLSTTADNATFSTTTLADGTYVVDGLPAGEYRVDVDTATLPIGLVNTDDEDGDLDSTTPVTLGVNDDHRTADFGYVGDANIGDTVYLDLDGDGNQDAGEPGVPGQTVTLNFAGDDGIVGNADDIVLTTTTDSNGEYLFENLPDGDYRVTVVGGITTDATNSGDPDGATANQSDLTITGGVDDLDQDFGYVGDNAVGDLVWWDTNRDGVIDADTLEPRLEGVEVRVTSGGIDDDLSTTADNIVITTVATGVDGEYFVDGLPDGTYQVDVVGGLPAGMDNTFDADGTTVTPNDSSVIALAGGTTDRNQDFGYAGTGSIGDIVYFDRDGDGTQDPIADEPGIAGVELTLTFAGTDGVLGNADDITIVQIADADGGYDFTGLPAGDYTVEVTDGLPSGAVNSDDPDLTGAAPDVGDGTSSVTLADGEDNDDQDFGYDVDAGLGDRVWWDFDRDGVQDPDEPGVNGVTLTVVFFGDDGVPGGTDDETFTTVTSGDGDWFVSELPEGNYSIAIGAGVPAGFTNTYDADSGTVAPDGATSLTAHSGIDVLQDFGIAGNSSIGDTVWLDLDGDGTINGEEVGLEGVDVTLTWAGPDGIIGNADDVDVTTTTGPLGNYLFEGLPAGTYDVAVDETTLPAGLNPSFDRDGTTVTPDGATTGIALGTDQDITDVDFGYQGDARIGDTIYLDRDRDGTQDVGGNGDEPGIPGVGVTLTWEGENGIFGDADDVTFTTTTGPDGFYEFTGLPAGEFQVDVDGSPTGGLPVAVTNTDDEDGDNDGSTPVDLSIGEDHDTADFGYAGVASIGDTIYIDLDGDGVQGPNEPGVPGQTVTLTGPLGTFTTVTGPDGTYSFDNLPDATYTVTVVGGIVDAANNTGDPDVAGPSVGDDTSTVTITGGVSNDAQDFGYQGTAALGDTLFVDADNDGVDDGAATDPRLDGVDVVVTWFGPDGVAGGGDDVVIPVDPTDSNGLYLVTGLPIGSYSVTPDTDDITAGLTPSDDADDAPGESDGTSTVTLADGETNLDQDFAYIGTGSIGDDVWYDQNGDGIRDADEPGFEGATVTLTWLGPDGIAGTDDVVYVTTVADDGSYLFEDLPSGEFTVEISGLPAGVVPTADPDGGADSSSAVTLGAGESNLDQDFGYVGTAGLGDMSFLETDDDGEHGPGEPGVEGVVVTVTSAGVDGIIGTSDDLVVVTVTDSDGNYQVGGLPADTTQVEIDTDSLLPGLVPVVDADGGDPAVSVVILIDGENDLDQDFGVAGPGGITGTVIDVGGGGIPDGIGGVTVTVTLDGPDGPIVITTVTELDGSFDVGGLPPGDYTVEVLPSDEPGGFTPTAPTIVEFTIGTDGTATPESADFPFTEPISIGDLVWIDIDTDGVFDGGEVGASGVTVRLLDSGGEVVATTTTGADGTYLFENLEPGTYTVVIDPTTFPDGTTRASDPDATDNGRYTVTVRGGDTVRNADFGLSSPPLPATGSDATLRILTVGFGTLIVGLLLAFGIRRRGDDDFVIR